MLCRETLEVQEQHLQVAHVAAENAQRQCRHEAAARKAAEAATVVAETTVSTAEIKLQHYDLSQTELCSARAELSESQANLQEQVDRRTAADSAVSAAQEELAKTQTKLHELAEQHDVVTKELTDSRGGHAALEKKAAQFEAAHAQAVAQIGDLSTQLQKRDEAQSELSETLASRADVRQSELSDAHAQLGDARAELSDVHTQLSVATACVGELEERLAAQASQMTKMEAQLAEQSALAEAQVAEIERLESVHCAAQQQSAQVQRALEYDQEVEAAAAQQLLEKLEQAQQAADEATARAEAQESACRDAEAASRRAEDLYQVTCESLAKAQALHAAQAEASAQNQQQVEMLSTALKDAENALGVANTEKQHLADERATALAEIGTLQQQVKALESQVDGARAGALADLQAKNGEENDALVKKVALMETEHEAEVMHRAGKSPTLLRGPARFCLCIYLQLYI
jgi:chromosome segregation ATPase